MQSIKIVSHRPDAGGACTSGPRTICSFRVSPAYCQTNLVPIPDTSRTPRGRPASHHPEAGDASFPQNAPDASPNCAPSPQPTGKKVLTALQIIFRHSRACVTPPLATQPPPGVK